MSAVDPDEVLLVSQVAPLLKMHPQTVHARIKDGSLQAVKRGNRYLIRRRWVDAFLTDEPAKTA